MVLRIHQFIVLFYFMKFLSFPGLDSGQNGGLLTFDSKGEPTKLVMNHRLPSPSFEALNHFYGDPSENNQTCTAVQKEDIFWVIVDSRNHFLSVLFE